MLGRLSRVSDSVGLGCNSKIYISNKFLGDVDSAMLGTTFRKPKPFHQLRFQRNPRFADDGNLSHLPMVAQLNHSVLHSPTLSLI